MYSSRHALSKLQANHRARHAGAPQPGNPGYASRPSTLGAIVLPITAGLLGLAVVLLILYRTIFE